MPTALFRCDATPELGIGHVMRCLTLADALHGQGWKCLFASLPRTGELVPALEHSPHLLIKLAAEGDRPHQIEDMLPFPIDWLVVDHYGWDASRETRCRDWATHILVIDDMANRSHDCELLLDQTYGRNAADYTPLVIEQCQLLLGTDYALLRPQFAAAREETLVKRRQNKNKQATRALVSFGGGDTLALVRLALQAIKPCDALTHVDVVTGSANSEAEIKLLAANLPQEVTIHCNVEDMAGLMAGADLAIGAAGTTSWERCCLGLPTLLLTMADNQQTIARQLEKAGAVRWLGDTETLTEHCLRDALLDITASPPDLWQMSENAAALCDGLGAGRVVTQLANIS